MLKNGVKSKIFKNFLFLFFKLCKEISRRHSFEYDLNSILSRLLYGRILFPSSKLSTFQQSQKLLEQPDFELHDVYRALSVLAQESDFIQSELYKNSLMVSKRKTGVIFYDCTNLEDDVSAIVKVNHNRWEIEECFRIMKSEFLARPVYLSRDDRIKAHFTTCFLSLILYRYLEKRLQNRYSCTEIIECLRDMNFLRVRGTGSIPCYTRSSLTDDLHKAFGFETDHEVITTDQMKKIYKISKK